MEVRKEGTAGEKSRFDDESDDEEEEKREIRSGGGLSRRVQQ